MNWQQKWIARHVPDLSGKLAIVTGSTGGLGLQTTRILGEHGANVIIAGRNAEKAKAVIAQLQTPKRNFSFRLLDLASLDSVSRFAQSLRADFDTIDILINNAGVMAPPERQETADQFELQFGTNHLGHFALTGQLLPMLKLAEGGSVVVSVASLAAWRGSIPFGDLNARQSYNAFDRYSQSKLANLLFAMELDRRSGAAGWGIHSRAAHPGWALSDILDNGPMLGKRRVPSLLFNRVARSTFRLLGQDVESGALPLIYAACSAAACDGCYYGPQGRGERTGVPGLAGMPPSTEPRQIGQRLWDVSEQMTGIYFT